MINVHFLHCSFSYDSFSSLFFFSIILFLHYYFSYDSFSSLFFFFIIIFLHYSFSSLFFFSIVHFLHHYFSSLFFFSIVHFLMILFLLCWIKLFCFVADFFQNKNKQNEFNKWRNSNHAHRIFKAISTKPNDTNWFLPNWAGLFRLIFADRDISIRFFICDFENWPVDSR